MFHGRFNLFSCDFCDTREYVQGFGLPKAWKWIPGPEVRHICPACEEAGKHGDLPLIESGQTSKKKGK